MKKCSKTAHHTMTELNITPLLDLAFVLLVIFIITTTPIVNDAQINLPKAPKHMTDPPKQAYYITIGSDGVIALSQTAIQLADLQPKLVAMRLKEEGLNVIVRADSKTKYGQIRAVLDACQQANLTKVELATDPGIK